VGICPTPNGQPSGDATQAFGSSGFIHGSVNVTASGLGAVALSNAFHGAATTALQPLTALPMPAAPVAAD
jgi:hypothetical protein